VVVGHGHTNIAVHQSNMRAFLSVFGKAEPQQRTNYLSPG